MAAFGVLQFLDYLTREAMNDKVTGACDMVMGIRTVADHLVERINMLDTKSDDAKMVMKSVKECLILVKSLSKDSLACMGPILARIKDWR